MRNGEIAMTTKRSSTAAAAAGDQLVPVTELLNACVQRRPDASHPDERVSFGTSGHRGSSLAATFNEAHVLASVRGLEHRRRIQEEARAIVAAAQEAFYHDARCDAAAALARYSPDADAA